MGKNKQKSNREDDHKKEPEHLRMKIENPETGKITKGEIGSLDKKGAAQNPERQKEENKKENM